MERWATVWDLGLSPRPRAHAFIAAVLAVHGRISASGRVRFTTESGAEYLLDYDERVWRRARNSASATLRTANEIFIAVEPTPIRLGAPVRILCPPLDGGDLRLVTSTRVVRIRYDV